VLVIGFGNSGGEIALDLANSGSMSHWPFAARSRSFRAICSLSHSVVGDPVRRLPARLVDFINRPVLRLAWAIREAWS